MKPIVYIGNFLSKHKTYETASDLLISILVRSGFKVTTASNHPNKVKRILDITAALIKNKKRKEVIIIDVFSTLNFYQAFWANFIAKCMNKPSILVLHGGNLPTRFKRNPRLSKYLLRNASGIVAPSMYLKDVVEKLGYTVVYIPNMLEINTYEFAKRSKIKPKLLWVRAFDATYNPQMVVEVLKILTETHPKATLTMVGPDKDGSLAQTKKLAINYKLEDKIRFTGALTKNEWHQLAKQSDVFINTTTVDNTPVSVMEAMALGLPVVSTNVGGIPYLLSHDTHALLCDSNDVQGMVAHINCLLQHPSLVERLCLNARTKVEQIDAELVKKQWIELIEHV